MSNIDFIMRVVIVALVNSLAIVFTIMFSRIYWIVGTETGHHAVRIRQANRQKDTAPDNKAGTTSLKITKH